jgi:hypothetical protein
MSDLRIDLQQNRTAFGPGDVVAGRASWRTDTEPESAELRLFWYTQGKGTQDVEIVQGQMFHAPRSMDEREFTFALPHDPYSFSGKLISLSWAIELIVEPGSHVQRCEIVMSPTGREVQILNEGA